ncbi:HAD family hydrolase [Haloprofundus salinisoli]|uniref:HAD family hydrolase n=1 Tax=Haloprofundus salinisoli TaxID=2876193 RepID=UPI001CC9C310|nr:HAD family hydrolase [Haloprofundus salinisoli]
MAVVYVDLDGTLVRYDRSFADMFASAAESTGVPAGEAAEAYYTERFFEQFAAFDDDPYLAAARELCAEYAPEANPEAFAEARIEAELRASVVAPSAVDALESLAAEHRLGVLSNGVGDVQRAKLDRHGLSPLFDEVLVSHDVGVTKPDRRIFEMARDRLPGDEHVYVADDPEDDIAPANEAGFRTILVGDPMRESGEVTNGETESADHRIAPDGFGRIESILAD